jgi:hypothetical protein
MVLTASLCDASHFNKFELGKKRGCISCRVAPDFAADLSVQIMDHGRNAKEREIGSSAIYSVHTCVDLINIIINYMYIPINFLHCFPYSYCSSNFDIAIVVTLNPFALFLFYCCLYGSKEAKR